jgi:hypothetical protein
MNPVWLDTGIYGRTLTRFMPEFALQDDVGLHAHKEFITLGSAAATLPRSREQWTATAYGTPLCLSLTGLTRTLVCRGNKCRHADNGPTLFVGTLHMFSYFIFRLTLPMN